MQEPFWEQIKSYEMDLIETSGHLIDEYIEANIIDYYKKNFEDDVINHVFGILNIQLGHLFDDNIEDRLVKIIYKAMNKYYRFIMPIRAFKKTFIHKTPNKSSTTKKIKYIRSKPQPEQKTEEWYKFRYQLITASNAYKVLGTKSKINELICEKCKPLHLNPPGQIPSTETAFHHGIRYEPLSVMYYEYTYKTTIEDFGCIQHDVYKCLGASPDGINVDSNSELYGRMLEIKNPVSRTITGEPENEYWMQMQLQMEVCNLNYCDFLETKFEQYEDKIAFDLDGSFNITNEGLYKGVILHFIDKDNHHYEYAPFNCDENEFNKWEKNVMEVNENMHWVENIYWKLTNVSCILVLRNKKWFTSIIDKVTDVWKIIEKERVDGSWINRKPKQRVKSDKLPFKSIKKVCQIITVDI